MAIATSVALTVVAVTAATVTRSPTAKPWAADVVIVATLLVRATLEIAGVTPDAVVTVNSPAARTA